MKKLSVFLALLMLLSTFSFAAFAADGAVLTVGSATAKPGETVTVTIALKNNPGIVGAQFDVKFDASVLSVATYTAKNSKFLVPAFDAEKLAAKSKVTFAMATLLEIVSGDISLVDVSFKIADNAAPGTYDLTVENLSVYTYDESADKNSDKQFPYVAATAEKGTITVTADSGSGTGAGTGTGKTEGKFTASKTYDNRFTDVTADKWFYDFVTTAYEYGLANGTSNTKFSPDSKFTVAQALTAAVNIHKTYYGMTVRAAAEGEAWYTPYVEYCVENGIIAEGQFTEFDKKITRGEMAIVFANILPAAEYAAKRTGVCPDVTSDMACYKAVEKLYQAGIVGGDAGTGNYRPNDEIARSEACVIFTRIALPSKR